MSLAFELLGNDHAEADAPIAITRWRLLQDSTGVFDEGTWGLLEALLSVPNPRPADATNPRVGGWSPAVFAQNHRRLDHVERVTALGIDFDTGALSLERLRELYPDRRVIVHNTRRSTPRTPWWRVVIAVSREMTKEEHSVVWAAERERLARLGIKIDDATKDASRFWYLPMVPIEGDYVFESLNGEPLDVDAIVDDARSRTPTPVSTHASEPVQFAPTSRAVPSSLSEPEPAWLARISRSTRERRASAWIEKADIAIQGQRGSDDALRVCSAIARGFALGDSPEARRVLGPWNARCEPPWSDRELDHKIADARHHQWGELLRRERPKAPATEDPADGGDGVTPPDFERGDHVELGERLVQELAPREALIFDELHPHRYDETRGLWLPVERATESRIVQGFAGKTCGPKHKPLGISAADVAGAVKLAHDRISHPGFFGDARGIVAFTNCVVRVGSAGTEVLAHASEHRVRAGFPFAYAPGAQPRRFLAFLEDVFRDDEDRIQKELFLQEFLGACVLGIVTTYQRCVVAIGSGGEGKSTLATVAHECMPEGTTSAIPPQDWGQEYRRAMLVGKHLNVVGELPERDIIASEAFKAIVTGDPIVGRVIRESPLMFRPRAGHFFAANRLPGTSDQTEGFWRRFVVLLFNRSFVNDPARDAEMGAKLLSERAEIVSWLVEGAARLVQTGHYTIPSSHHEAVAVWRRNADQVALFVDADLRPLDHDESLAWGTSGAALYQAYVLWCSSNGHRALASNRFAERMKGLGHAATKTRRGMIYPVVRLSEAERAVQGGAAEVQGDPSLENVGGFDA